MTAELYLYNRLTRTVCPIPDYDPVAFLRQQIADAVERENMLHAMQIDMRRDCMDAVVERRRLQRELWAMEYRR